MPLRQLLPWWIGLTLLAALAWVVTVQQADGMGVGPGTMGLTLIAFIALWVVMMAAMMFPSAAPMVAVYVGIQRGRRRKAMSSQSGATTLFVVGYVITWTSQDGQDGYGYGVYAQRYDAHGGAVGPEFKANTLTIGYQSQPAVAGLASGTR